jgi:hypothetical protein
MSMMFTIFLIFCLSLQEYVDAAISSDCQKVIDAWTKLNGKIYSPTSCCEMEGVDCDSDSNVVSISWRAMHLKGALPPELFELQNLRFLEISDNQMLLGTFPSLNENDLPNLEVL